ncbi:MAG TPA: DUF5709 domain-containing protein [Streptomyces sp.]|uniref:DUF5709 domain-containing protein n=1 Tax=Streptomyces sp. TaxID=1931 RepID=UPI002CCCE969|nr:DUF5709 domain-containing protein [Streptomyces sp.]HWU09461.1 DUF5709 domain-containing protein [Streptomyces sp.]
MTDSDRGDDVYQPQEPEASDPDDLLDPQDTLDTSGIADVLDEGHSPPDRPWVVDDQGTTATEQHAGESLDSRLAREVPEGAAPVDGGPGDLADGGGEFYGTEAGTGRAGRLTQEGDRHVPSTLTAQDVGTDGAAASAEEAAMHLIPEEQDLSGEEPAR